MSDDKNITIVQLKLPPHAYHKLMERCQQLGMRWPAWGALSDLYTAWGWDEYIPPRVGRPPQKRRR